MKYFEVKLVNISRSKKKHQVIKADLEVPGRSQIISGR